MIPNRDELIEILNEQALTICDLADKFKVSILELRKDLESKGIPEPSVNNKPFEHYQIIKKLNYENSVVFDIESLVYDDIGKTIINGIKLTNVLNTAPIDIIEFYHPDKKCYVCRQAADGIANIDGNPNNVLISNLVPICKSCGDRFIGGALMPLNELIFTFGYGTVFTVWVKSWIDKQTGQSYLLAENNGKPSLFKELVKKFAVDPIKKYPELICPNGLNAEAIALFAWRELTTSALLKGITRIDVKVNDDRTCVFTEAAMLGYVHTAVSKHLPQHITMPGQMTPGNNRPNNSLIIK